eukprot:3108912-Amphidinium_carterae.1
MIKQLNTQLHAVEEEFDQQHGQKKILEDMLEKKNEQEHALASLIIGKQEGCTVSKYQNKFIQQRLKSTRK